MDAAYLREVEDRDEEHRVVLTGRYEVSLQIGDAWPEDSEHPDLESALAFARGRADRVFVDVARERYVAHGKAEGIAPLTDAVAAGASRRRRLPGQEWLDRTPLDEPIPYAVRLEVTPRRSGDREAERVVVDGVVRALAAAGFRDLARSETERDAALRGIEAQVEAAGARADDVGWMVTGPLGHVLRAVVDARTHREAASRARGRARDAVDVGAWRVDVTAWPVAAEDPEA